MLGEADEDGDSLALGERLALSLDEGDCDRLGLGLALADEEGEVLALGETDGLSLELGLAEDDGETLALSLLDGLTEEEGETDGDSLLDGEVLALGLTLGEIELDGLAEPLGERLGDSLGLGDTLALGLTDGLTLLLSSGTRAKERCAIVERPEVSPVPEIATRRIEEMNVCSIATLFAGQLAAECTVPSASPNCAAVVITGPSVEKVEVSSLRERLVRAPRELSPSARRSW